MTSEQRYRLGYIEDESCEPGLVRALDGTVWLINPDCSRVQVLGGSGGGSGPVTPPVSEDTTVTWDPSVQQIADPDTIWGPFDPTLEAAIGPLAGGLIDNTGIFDNTITNSSPWRAGSPYVVTPGKYGMGIRGSAGGSGCYIWHPCAAVPRDQFTVEFNVRCDTDWAACPAQINLLTLGASGTGNGPPIVYFQCIPSNAGKLRVGVFHAEGIGVNYFTDGHAHSAHTEVNLAVTYDGTTMSFLEDSVLIGSHTVPPPVAWTGSDRSEGLIWLNASTGADAWTIDGQRVSRRCRTIGIPTLSSATNKATIGTASAGTINQNLRGGLHNYASVPADVGDAAIEALAGSYFTSMRTGKFMSACPVKAGGTDATHPTLGASTQFSYNFGPLDHSVQYAAARFPSLYLNIDSCNQLLGGSVAPYTALQCADATELAQFASYASQVPNDLTKDATLTADMVDRVLNHLGVTVHRWGIGNEPDGSFWSGTSTQWFQHYASRVTAIRSVDPTAKVGGPEVAEWNDAATWVHGLITYCGANNVPLDFISIHCYTGELGQIARAKVSIAAWCVTAGIPMPEIVVGEWGWQSAYTQGGNEPFKNVNMWVNGFGASFDASVFAALQNAGVTEAIYCHCAPAEKTDTVFDCCGLYSRENVWASQNVFNIWQRLGDEILAVTSHDLENGVIVLPTKKTSNGNVFVLVANHKWRMERSMPLQLSFAVGLGVTTCANHWIIDATHSNFADENVDDGTLQTVAPPTVTGSYTLTLPAVAPRSVHLLEMVA